MNEPIELLAELLVKNGLKYAFGVTGSGTSLSLITELEDREVCYFPVAHEASAALMAGAVSNASGSISVSISIKGPGLANMLPGIISNHFENNPTLSISEAYSSDTPVYRKHKRMDHRALLSTVVKGIISLGDLEHGFVNLLKTARREVPGPVHIDLCLTNYLSEPPISTDHWSTSSQKDNVCKELNGHLERSERPVLIVGSVATRRSWAQQLKALQVPVFTTVAAKGVLDESLPQSAGIFTGAGGELAPESELFLQADLFVAFGLRNTEVLQPKPFDKPLIIVDEIDRGLAEGFGANTLIVDADTDLVLGVLDKLCKKAWGLEAIKALLDRLRDYLLATEWSPAVCFEVLNQLDFPHSLVLDTGSFCTVGEHLWWAGSNRYFMGTGNGRFMGTAIPSAIGLAICHPGLPVFCVMGDGGVRMYPAEIKLAVEKKLPVCFILMTDGRYGSVACVPQSRPMSSRAVTVFGPSWWKSVGAMGCEACLVASREAFTMAVQGWDRKGPLFIEAAFDPELYADMTRRLRVA